MADQIRIAGLREFQRALKRMDSDLPKALRLAMNEAAQIVVDEAKPKVPRRTGRAAASIRVASTRTAARVREGGARVPYMPWLDFGGTVGRGRKAAVRVGRGHHRTADQQARAGSVKRPYYSDGRYIWRAVGVRRDDITAVLQKALVSVAEQAGLKVS